MRSALQEADEGAKGKKRAAPKAKADKPAAEKEPKGSPAKKAKARSDE